MDHLRARWFEDVVAVPGLACLYRRDGSRIDESVHRRYGRMVGPPPEQTSIPSSLERIGGPVVYGGFLPKHFGHFLLESLVRTWVYPTLRPGPIPFIHFRHRFHIHEIDLLEAIVAPAGASLQQVTAPSLLGSVLVPDQGIDLGGVHHPDMLVVFDAIRDRLVGNSSGTDRGPIYLSRSRLGRGHRSTLGEGALVRRLTRHGIRIVHPQELPLREQIALVSGARTVIGLHGTALHLTLLRDGDGSRTIALGPRQPHDPQVRIDQFRGAEHRHLHVQYPLHPRIPGFLGGRALELGPYRDVLIPALAERRIVALL